MRLQQWVKLRSRCALKFILILSAAFSCTPTSAPTGVQVEQQRGTDYKDVRGGLEKSVKDIPQSTAPSAASPAKGGADEAVVNQTVAVIKIDGSVLLPDGPVEIAKYELPPAVGSPGAPVAVSLDVTSDSIALTTVNPTKSAPTPVSAVVASDLTPTPQVEVPSVAVIEVGPAASAEFPSCSSSVPSDRLKPNTDYMVATCLADLSIGEPTTVTTLARPVEVQSAVVTPDEIETKIVLTLPPNQNSVEVAISIVSDGQVKWLDPATGELGLTEEEAYVPVLGKPEEPTVAEVHAATVPKGEFAVQVVTRNKKKMKTAKSKPVLGRGANSALDDRHEGKRTADQLVEEAEGNQDRASAKHSGKKDGDRNKVLKNRTSQLRQQLLWLQKDAEQRKLKEMKSEKREDREEAVEKESAKLLVPEDSPKEMVKEKEKEKERDKDKSQIVQEPQVVEKTTAKEVEKKEVVEVPKETTKVEIISPVPTPVKKAVEETEKRASVASPKEKIEPKEEPKSSPTPKSEAKNTSVEDRKEKAPKKDERARQ